MPGGFLREAGRRWFPPDGCGQSRNENGVPGVGDVFLFWAIRRAFLFFLCKTMQGEALKARRQSTLEALYVELSTRANWERITQHSHNTFTVHTTLTQPNLSQPNLSQPFRPVCNPLPRPNPLQPSHSPTHTTALSDAPTLTLHSPTLTLSPLSLCSLHPFIS